MANFNQPGDAQHQARCTIEELDEITTELDAEKAVAHTKGYICYSQRIEHEHFKPMGESLDKALRGWHNKHDKL